MRLERGGEEEHSREDGLRRGTGTCWKPIDPRRGRGRSPTSGGMDCRIGDRANLKPPINELFTVPQTTANAPPIMTIFGIIPARYASTRFPGKPLHPVAGKPLIQHVVERCKLARSLNEVIVATDDPRIAEAARPFARVEITRTGHPSGTDRIAEVAARCDCDA